MVYHGLNFELKGWYVLSGTSLSIHQYRLLPSCRVMLWPYELRVYQWLMAITADRCLCTNVESKCIAEKPSVS